MVEFGGWEMPVSYAGIIAEHNAVRGAAGLFDVSHMGEFIVSGADTWQFLRRVVTNNCARLAPDGVLYTVMCNDDGTVVDDLLVSRLGDDRAMLVVNAANIEKDFAHIDAMRRGGVTLENASDAYALLAVQGPKSRDVIRACPSLAPFHETIQSLAYYRYARADTPVGAVTVSRTGYTGEVGYEVFVAPQHAETLWREILQCGAPYGILPVGLAARDTLRFEACFALYGHELDDQTTPLEAGLRWVVKFKNGGFRGYDALLAEKEEGSKKQLVGLEIEGRNIARQGNPIVRDEAPVGHVTSGSFSPTLRKSLALGYVESPALESDDVFGVDNGRKILPAHRVDIPFYPSRAAGD